MSANYEVLGRFVNTKKLRTCFAEMRKSAIGVVRSWLQHGERRACDGETEKVATG